MKHYNYQSFETVEKGFITTLSTSKENQGSLWNYLEPPKRLFVPETHEKLLHKKKGTVSWVTMATTEKGVHFAGSQFFITLADKHLEHLDSYHCVFGKVNFYVNIILVVEGLDVLDKINATIVDDKNRPYRDIRIKHTIILDDPFDDPAGFIFPDFSPEPSLEIINSMRIGENEDVSNVSYDEKKAKIDEAKAQALTLEMIGDLPFADIRPPDNVLFVCKLNPITRDDDLHLIFSRFGQINNLEIVREAKTGKSLQYAFIEYENAKDCEQAYAKMDNVLIDDRRIRVDFSQSVSKLHSGYIGNNSKPKPLIHEKDKGEYSMVFEGLNSESLKNDRSIERTSKNHGGYFKEDKDPYDSSKDRRR